MAKDKYTNFEKLFSEKIEDGDYRIIVVEGKTDDLIMAPHGGKIELHTSQIARKIAGDDLSLYLFEGIMSERNQELHVTSANYDEPQALKIAEKSARIVAIHGRCDEDDPNTTCIGGLDTDTGQKIAQQLKKAGFPIEAPCKRFPALNPQNICNRGTSKKGVQLEIPISLRTRLISDKEELERFAGAINKALSNEI